MNAVSADAGTPASAVLEPVTDRASATLVLLGTGGVGRALLRLLSTPAACHLRLAGVANSRRQIVSADGLDPESSETALKRDGGSRDDAALTRILDTIDGSCRVIVDATASVDVARAHARWLAAGYHVVTANKGTSGGQLDDWRALQAAQHAGGTVYGDAATVGAGLPVIAAVRRLRTCGDALLTLEGVFSGSLSWLFNQYDGTQPFSALLRHASELGYTEPDPRSDLSGEDVARKLLILARHAGFALGEDEVQIENLVPEPLRAVETGAFLQRMDALDAPLAARHAQAASRGCALRYLARLNQRGHARVGLVEVPATHPAARLQGTDNQFALSTTRYHDQPLVIQGPGAGRDVTAQALLGDLLALR